MSATLIFFYLFGAIAVGAAIAVVSVRSPVHAALCLVQGDLGFLVERGERAAGRGAVCVSVIVM